MTLEPTFELFGVGHLVTLALVAGFGVGIPLVARRLPDPWPRRIAVGLAVCLLAWRAVEIAGRNILYQMPIRDQLPLHLCGILVFLSAWMLWRQSYPVFEVTYFWAIGGTFQALVTPDLPVGFPHPVYISFFISHGLLILATLYAVLVFRFRPRPVSILKAWLAVNVYALLITPVNLLLDTNYLFLRGKPAAASLLDHFGPWPWYLLVLEGLALMIFALCYLPFWVQDLRGSAERNVRGLFLL